MKINFVFSFYYIIFFSNIIFGQIPFNKEPDIRVRIIYTLDSLNINFNSHWILSSSDQKNSIYFNAGDSILLTIEEDSILMKQSNSAQSNKFTKMFLNGENRNNTLSIKNVPFGIGWWWEGIEDRIYEGDFAISINGNEKFDVIVTLPLEKYLCGVVPYEIGNDTPIEALKSQVIAARSETVSAIISGKYRGRNFDICADVECQVFAGNNKRTPETDKAVEETRGLCLFHNDEIIGAYYASNCGGISENIENVWPERSGPVPYYSSHFDSDSILNYDPENNPYEWINSNPDVYCNPIFHPELPSWSQNNFRWKVEISTNELTQNLNKVKLIGNLKDIEVLERGKSGRIIKSCFIGSEDSLLLNSELEIRKIKNPPFRSSCFVFEKYFNSDGDEFYKFNGAGWGHGVGMCQSGAVARAYTGQTFQQILKHYFPETEIRSV